MSSSSIQFSFIDIAPVHMKVVSWHLTYGAGLCWQGKTSIVQMSKWLVGLVEYRKRRRRNDVTQVHSRQSNQSPWKTAKHPSDQTVRYCPKVSFMNYSQHANMIWKCEAVEYSPEKYLNMFCKSYLFSFLSALTQPSEPIPLLKFN